MHHLRELPRRGRRRGVLPAVWPGRPLAPVRRSVGPTGQSAPAAEPGDWRTDTAEAGRDPEPVEPAPATRPRPRRVSPLTPTSSTSDGHTDTGPPRTPGPMTGHPPPPAYLVDGDDRRPAPASAAPGCPG